MQAKYSSNSTKCCMNLWCLDYELFLMRNNKTLMKSIAVSPSFTFRLLLCAFFGSCIAFGVARVDFENLLTSERSSESPQVVFTVACFAFDILHSATLKPSKFLLYPSRLAIKVSKIARVSRNRCCDSKGVFGIINSRPVI